MQSFSCENPFNPPSCSRLVSGRINAVPLCLFLCITMPSASAKCKRVNTHTLFGVLVDNTRGYFTSCVASNEYNVRPYYLPKHGIRGLLFHCILVPLRPPSAKKWADQTGIVQCNRKAYFARSLAFIR